MGKQKVRYFGPEPDGLMEIERWLDLLATSINEAEEQLAVARRYWTRLRQALKQHPAIRTEPGPTAPLFPKQSYLRRVPNPNATGATAGAATRGKRAAPPAQSKSRKRSARARSGT